jgi:cytochrome c oxidase assembly protein subunit 15
MRREGWSAYEGVPVVALGSSAAMWFAGYLCRLPGSAVPGWVVGSILLLLLAVGGAVASRTSPAGWRAALAVGFVASLVNLLVLASVLASAPPTQVRSAALLWVPASLLAGAVVAWLGAAVAGWRRREVVSVHWSSAFAMVTAAAALLVIVVGGLVTTHDAGLAVVDWPNTFGRMMFLYPLSRMTGGIYFEHAHRLFGALVGLATVGLAVHLWRREGRELVRRLAGLAVLAVIGQGILGGLRVTGRFTLATDPALTAPKLTLAAVHGVTAQLFFALLVVLAVLTSRTWREPLPPPVRADSWWWGVAVTVAAVAQLSLGAMLRHFGTGLLTHATFGAALFGLAVLAGTRARWLAGTVRPLRQSATVLLVVVSAQVALGIGAWLGTASLPPGTSGSGAEVLVVTAHQVNGALVLGASVATALWWARVGAAGARAKLRPAG